MYMAPKGIQHAHTIYMNNLISQAGEKNGIAFLRVLNRPLAFGGGARSAHPIIHPFFHPAFSSQFVRQRRNGAEVEIPQPQRGRKRQQGKKSSRFGNSSAGKK